MQNMTPRQKAGFILLLVAVAVLAVLFWSNARAQGAELPEVSFDPRVWFGSAAALGVFVAFTISLIKEHVYQLKGLATLAASFGLSIGLSIGATFIPFFGFDETIPGAVAFGVSAAVVASGGWASIEKLVGGPLADILRALLGGGNAPLAENSSTRTDAAKSRLSR